MPGPVQRDRRPPLQNQQEPAGPKIPDEAVYVAAGVGVLAVIIALFTLGGSDPAPVATDSYSPSEVGGWSEAAPHAPAIASETSSQQPVAAATPRRERPAISSRGTILRDTSTPVVMESAPVAKRPPAVRHTPGSLPWRTTEKEEDDDEEKRKKRHLPMPSSPTKRGPGANTPAAPANTPDAISTVLGELEAAQANGGRSNPVPGSGTPTDDPFPDSGSGSSSGGSSGSSSGDSGMGSGDGGPSGGSGEPSFPNFGPQQPSGSDDSGGPGDDYVPPQENGPGDDYSPEDDYNPGDDYTPEDDGMESSAESGANGNGPGENQPPILIPTF